MDLGRDVGRVFGTGKIVVSQGLGLGFLLSDPINDQVAGNGINETTKVRFGIFRLLDFTPDVQPDLAQQILDPILSQAAGDEPLQVRGIFLVQRTFECGRVSLDRPSGGFPVIIRVFRFRSHVEQYAIRSSEIQHVGTREDP